MKDKVSKIIAKIPSFLPADAEDEEESFDFFITDDPPKQIKECKTDDNDDDNGKGGAVQGTAQVPASVSVN